MSREKFSNFPLEESETDLEESRKSFPSGLGCYIPFVSTQGIKGKGIVVYEIRERETDEYEHIHPKPTRKCANDLIICGYRKTTIFRGSKVQEIPFEDREVVKSDLLKILEKRGMVFGCVEFDGM